MNFTQYLSLWCQIIRSHWAKQYCSSNCQLTSISCCICGLLRIICLIRSGFDIMLCKEIKNLRHSNNQIDSLHTLRHTVCRVLMESQPAKKVMFISVIWSLLVYYHSSVNRRENTSTQEVDRWSTGYSFT